MPNLAPEPKLDHPPIIDFSKHDAPGRHEEISKQLMEAAMTTGMCVPRSFLDRSMDTLQLETGLLREPRTSGLIYRASGFFYVSNWQDIVAQKAIDDSFDASRRCVCVKNPNLGKFKFDIGTPRLTSCPASRLMSLPKDKKDQLEKIQWGASDAIIGYEAKVIAGW